MSNPYAMMDLYGEIRPPSLPGSSQTSPRVRPSPRKPTFKPSKPPVAFRDKSSKFSVSNPFSVDGGIGGSSVITTATLNSTTQGQTVLNSSRLPFNAPISNRQDVQALEAWTQKELETFFVEENRGAISSIQRHISQVTVLDQTMKSLSDLIRVHCADQSALLWKIWSSASDLYGEIFNKMTQSVEELRIKLADKTLQTSILEEKVKSLRTSRNSERSAAAMLDDTNAVIRNLEEDLMLKDKELLELQSTITNIALWFPNFSKFSDSVLSRYLPPVNPDDKPVQFTPPITYNQPDATEELNKQIFLAQDYLLTDLKRLENLGIGLEIGTPFNHLHSKPDRSSSMLSSFGGAAYSPHDNTALPMGIFGGPEINKSFVAAKESEYNLQSNVDDEMAISHAVAAVQGTKGLKKTIHKPTMETTQESSEYLSEGSVRDFYKLQGKRATALDAKSGSFSTPTSLALNHAREALSQTTGSRDSIDIGMKYVVSSFEEQLELSRTKLRKTLDHMQEVEAAMQVKQSDYQSTIERLERELKVSQKREKALKDQLNAAKSEGEHILASLPTRFFASMRLPELPSLSIESMDDRFELDFEPMHILILDFMDKFVARSSFDILPWTYDTCNNLLNGQSCCLTNVQPLSFTIQDKSFASVAAALFIEYLLNKFHSSLKAKQIFDKTMSALLKKAYTIGFELDVIDTEWCHFYMKLFGIVLNPTNTTTDWVWYFESVDLNEQHISIDFSVHAYRALKMFMYRDASAMNFPIFQTEKLLLRMFEKVTTHSTLSENVEEKLLKEGMMLSKFWWRYISNGLFSKLTDSVKSRAKFPIVLENEESKFVPMIGVFDSINCAFQHILMMKSYLTTILKELFKFLKSMVPNGCADPTYSLVLQALLYTNPLLNHQDHDNLFGISKHEAQNHRFHNIQLMHQLKILEINGEMNEENFANTLLLFIDSDVVKSWSTLIDELSNSDFLQTGEKSQLVHLVEKFARNDNLEVFQPSGQTSTTSPSLHNELVAMGKGVTLFVEDLLIRNTTQAPQRSVSSKSAKSALSVSTTNSKFLDSINMNQMLQSEDISQFFGSDGTDNEFLVRLVGHGKLCYLPEFRKGLSIKVTRAWFTLATFKLILGGYFGEISFSSKASHDLAMHTSLDTFDLHQKKKQDIAEQFHKKRLMNNVFRILFSNAFESTKIP